MLQYKTVYLPGTAAQIKKKEWDAGFSTSLISSTVEPFGQMISEQAKGGWTLHSVVELPVNITRKKTFLEKIFGWIPILGRLLFPRMHECYSGVSKNVLTLVFVKEV